MTYSEKGGITQSLLTKSETRYLLRVFDKFFGKYSVEAVLQNIKELVTSHFYADLKRIIEAGYMMVNASPIPLVDDITCNNCSYAKLLSVVADMTDAQLALAEGAMNRLMEEHEFRLFATKPEVACHISTFRMMISRNRRLLQDAIHNVKFAGEEFTLQANMAKFNLAMFVDEVTAPFRLYEDATGKMIEIRNTIESNQTILSDKMMLSMILLSLLHTAYAHSRKGTTVFVSIQAAAEELSISVKSEGRQMPAIEKEHLFKPLNSSSTLENSLGANLYIAKKCIDTLGGRLLFLSEGTETVIQAKLPCLLK